MNNRVIVLEGPDCCGKSTLAETLRTEHGFKVIHTDKPLVGEDVFKTYTNALIEALRGDQPVVFDRLHLGEHIYGPIMRGKDLLGRDGIKLIDRIFAAHDVKYAVCLPGFANFRRNYLSRGDEYVTKLETAERIYGEYVNYADIYGVEIYNYENMLMGDMHELFFTPKHTLPAGCSGSPLARWLIVGETVNHRVLDHDVPFHHLQGSSGYLNGALSLTGVEEHDLAFANAYPRLNAGPRDLAAIVARMPNFKKAVALGRAAEKVCKSAGIPYAYVEHPACAKRFKFDQLKAYAKKIKEAMKHART